jgi:hypothetical protein
VALLAAQLLLFGADRRHAPAEAAARGAIAPSPSTDAIPVGRDPFASPFGAPGKGDRSGGVLVKPPGVVREGGLVTAATTVVNQSDARWLPPSTVTFVVRDGSGRVVAKATTTVSLGPASAETVVAPELDIDPASIAAIEARIDAAPLRAGRYRGPGVSVERASAAEGGRAISGTLAVDGRARRTALLSCAVFGPLDELAGATTATVDLSRASDGRLTFWLTVRPAGPGPYRASCSAS